MEVADAAMVSLNVTSESVHKRAKGFAGIKKFAGSFLLQLVSSPEMKPGSLIRSVAIWSI